MIRRGYLFNVRLRVVEMGDLYRNARLNVNVNVNVNNVYSLKYTLLSIFQSSQDYQLELNIAWFVS